MSINVTVAGTSVGVAVTSGIGPAGFITAPGTATNAFGTFQLTAGNGITITTSAGQFQVASYSTTQAAGFAPVQSVAGRTGAVTLQAADVTAGTFAIARIPTISYTALSNVPTSFTPSAHTHGTADVVGLTAAASAAAPVQSVNGLTGAVTIARADLTAAAEVHTHSTADIVSFTASAAAAAPVQSVAGRTGTISLAAADVSGLAAVATSGSYTSLSDLPSLFDGNYTSLANIPASFAPEAHTHSTSDVVGLTASFSQVGHTHDYAATSHTHDAADVVSGVLDFARLPAIGYTALAGVPTSFAPEAHTHSTADISGYSSLPAQAGANGPLVTDGTASNWATRYSVVDPVLVQGAGLTFTRDTAAGEITIAFAGGTSGIVVSSATPQPLGTATGGTSGDASRADHVHAMPSAADVGAASAVHSHVVSDITDFTSVANVVSVNGQTGVVTVTGGATAASVTTKSLTVDENDYDAGSSDIVRLTPSANVTLTGLAGGEDGVVRVLYNVGTHVVTLSSGNTNSVETNRFSIVSGNAVLSEGDSSSVWYDGTSQRWRVLEDQVAGGGGSGGGFAMSYLFG